MGDRKPKKTSSGSNDIRKNKDAKRDAARVAEIKPDDKPKGKGNKG